MRGGGNILILGTRWINKKETRDQPKSRGIGLLLSIPKPRGSIRCYVGTHVWLCVYKLTLSLDPPLMAQFSLNNVHKRGLKHHHFISFGSATAFDHRLNWKFKLRSFIFFNRLYIINYACNISARLKSEINDTYCSRAHCILSHTMNLHKALTRLSFLSYMANDEQADIRIHSQEFVHVSSKSSPSRDSYLRNFQCRWDN